MKSGLDLTDISVAYVGSSEPAVQRVSLHLPAGHVACLLGTSGSGKTTVLRAIAGFEPVRQGSITLDGQWLSIPDRHRPPELRRIGMMFQEYALFPHLSAAQNVGFGLQRLPRSAREARVKDMLTLVGLPDLAARFPHELSGGQQQRVALARALAPEPALLLLDEPFSNLDDATRAHLGREVAAILRQTGQTALMVTHNLAEAESLADWMGEMQQGRLLSWQAVR